MPAFRPFAALRPRPELAGRVCELPYDAVTVDEARARAAADPLSFFHVSRPDTSFPPDADPHAPAVYERGRQHLTRLIASGALVRDPVPHYYVYRLTMGTHRQVGVAGLASCAEYLSGAVRRHELTRADKEDDRVQHIEVLNAQTGPAFLAYRVDPELAALLARITEIPAAIEFAAEDGIQHAVWVVEDTGDAECIEAAFARQPLLYIADGHHRTAAASRVYKSRGGRGGSGHVLGVAFAHDQLQVLPYQRVTRDLNGHPPAEVERRLDAVLEPVAGAPDRPAAKHEISVYLGGRWRRLRFRAAYLGSPDPIQRLDVDLLQRHVLEPVFGIGDPRTSERIEFVGGIRGTAALAQLVETGRAACAFALFPTSVDDLLAVADRGGMMPPKSTWFEPKLRDGLFCHLLD